MPQVFVTRGDITRTVPVEAIATLINSDGMWYGGVDRAIMGIAGRQYHTQAFETLQSVGLYDGQVVVAKQYQAHAGAFKDVIFVVDDLQKPLGELVYTALKTAETGGYKSVGLPLMRCGVMFGLVEQSHREVAQQIKDGIDSFGRDFPDSTLIITIVVFDEPQMIRLLSETIGSLPQ